MTSVLRKTLLCLAVSASAFAAPFAQAADVAPSAARVYVDKLDMRSPQAAADTFLKAFARADYFAVHKLLSPEAQREFTDAVHTFDTERLLPRMTGSQLTGSVYFGAKSPEAAMEVAMDPSLFFDDIMYAAQRLYILPFTIGGNAKVGKVDMKGDAATVAVVSDGQPAALTLEMKKATSGRWKIDRIVWPGSSSEERPWGAPKQASTEAQPIRQAPAGPRIYPETLDTKTPEATANTFLKAYARSDYMEVQQLFSPGAQRDFSEVLFGPEFKLIPRMKDGELPGSVLFNKALNTDEVLGDPSLTFDDVMFAAQGANILPFTIGAGAKLGKVEQQNKQAKQATIEVVTDGKPAALTLQMILLPSGRWKVDRVVWAGSSAEARPWAAKQ